MSRSQINRWGRFWFWPGCSLFPALALSAKPAGGGVYANAKRSVFLYLTKNSKLMSVRGQCGDITLDVPSVKIGKKGPFAFTGNGNNGASRVDITGKFTSRTQAKGTISGRYMTGKRPHCAIKNFIAKLATAG